MNTILLSAIASSHPDTAAFNGPSSYLVGAIVALLILGYLIYTLLRPDKF